jgi:hypothetical protein
MTANRMSILGGHNQKTTINTTFATRLRVLVTDEGGNPLADVVVKFRVPPLGSSGRFPGNLTFVEVSTNSQGIARSPFLQANDQTGSFRAKATTAGLDAVKFLLTNLPLPPRIDRFVVNQGNPQRSVINSVTLIFDQKVAILPEVFRLTRVIISNGIVVQRLEVHPVTLARVQLVNGRTHATLRFPTPLIDGVYQLFVNRGQIRNGENDILEGANTFRFHRLLGDFDGDGRADV